MITKHFVCYLPSISTENWRVTGGYSPTENSADLIKKKMILALKLKDFKQYFEIQNLVHYGLIH